MRYVEYSLAPADRELHPLASTLASSSIVDVARMLDWNLSRSGTTMALFRIDGDRERVAAALEEATVVLEYDRTPVEGGEFYATVYTETVETERRLYEAFNRPQTVLVPPIEYRNGRVTCRIVGAPAALESTLDAVPDGIDVRVERLGRFAGRPAGVRSALTERQREVVQAALEVGYYETPRRATAADVADRLGCTASTASEHLRKAEARVIRELFDG